MIFLALVHYPVLNRKAETIASAVTNLDIHDIARVAATYGLEGYFIVTPLEEQRLLVSDLVSHWVHGSSPNSDRKRALSLVKVVPAIEDASKVIRDMTGKEPKVVATTARMHDNTLSWQGLRDEIRSEADIPFLLLFGTASGLADSVFEDIYGVLEPIEPQRPYNHLSVRSAVAIAVDRLCGRG